MDSNRRRESRIQANEAVLVTLLGPPGGDPIPCTTVDISGSGLSLLSPRPLPAGVPIKIEGSNRIMLAEVVRADPSGDQYTLGLKVSHALENLADLERLNRTLLGERDQPVPATVTRT